MKVVGVDGCRGGWVACTLGLDGSPEPNFVLHTTFSSILGGDVDVIGVDIPIGIQQAGVRAADASARRFVGPRASSVFSTPPRAVLAAATYAEALRLSRGLAGVGVTKQAFALRQRILEVDRFAHRDARIVEVHPEVSFRRLAGKPLGSKHTPDGVRERENAVLVACNTRVRGRVRRGLLVDALDAAAAAWSAARYARGEAFPLPEGAEERIGAIWC
jgi:predicted RNase H-like nuclease